MGKHNQKKKSKSSNASLGKALANNLSKKATKKNYVSDLHRFEDRAVTKTSLMSILEQDSLNEFADLVNLSKKKLEVQKQADLMEASEAVSKPHLAIYKSLLEEGMSRPKYAPLKLPRKPMWTKEMTKEQLIENENQAFLEWRRDIAMMEEGNVNLAITPFEKNLLVWKQLWSVIEKSNLLIQIVDCRNPSFFYSADLERYIKELDDKKHYLLLLNKADYLSESQITHWNDYFKEKGVEHIFFSALFERVKIEKLQETQTVVAPVPPPKDENSLLDEVRESIKVDEEQNKEAEVVEKLVQEEKLTLIDDCKIYSREEMLRLVRVLVRQRCKEPEGKEGRYMIGMVGYPNVGKSSVINVLCGAKKVGVAARPGKTKHFQTINIGSDICLWDWPGLVFPSFASSKAEMVCCGVIPIDNLKDYLAPMELVAKRISKEMFEKVYKIKLPEKFTASELLQVYSGYYGYVTGRGIPDESKAARIMLKDYNNGKILFVHLRPDYNKEIHGEINQSNVDYALKVDVQTEVEETKEEMSGDCLEEVKEHADEDAEPGDSAVGDVSEPESLKTTDSAVKQAAPQNMKEDEFDKVFFEQKKEIKLNKAQKRALKFAAKKGEDPNSVDLENPFLRRGKGKRRVEGYDKTETKKGGNSNKFNEFVKMEGNQA